MNKSKKRNMSIAVAALLMFIALPNVSPAFAKTLADIPLLGRVFEVVTIIEIEEKQGLSEVEVKIPQISTDVESVAIETINMETEDYIEQMINKYKENTGDGRSALNIDYEVVTDSENWFTLLIYSTEVQASGYEKNHYFNVDKSTGKYVAFSDVIVDFETKKDKISDYIIDQMKVKMENEKNSFFIKAIDGTGFESITENQNYYYTNGNLVISFDEYEVAPGYMGIVEFIIPKEIYE